MAEISDPADADAPTVAPADAPVLERLLALQEHDTAGDQLRHRLGALPEGRAHAAAAEALAAIEARAAEVAGRRHDLGRDQKRLEDELATLGARIADTERSLGAVTNPRELQALQERVASAKGRQSGLEDELLELLEAIDPVDAEAVEVAAERQAAVAELRRLAAAVDLAAGDVRTRLGAELAARDEAAAAVPADLLATYERLRTQLGGIAVARLDGNRCLGCHLTLPATEVDAIRHLPPEAVPRHEECGRILVRA